jgi:dihydrofolate reductase
MAPVYFTASSIDGYIADPDNSLTWLTSRDLDPDGPMAYQKFIEGVGALAMGSTTYRWIVENPEGLSENVTWPYAMPAWVFTHGSVPATDGDIRVVQGPVAKVHPSMVEAAGDKHVWVVGGGALAAQFAEAGLLDEVWVQYAPVSLGAGAPMLDGRIELSLEEVARNRDFACVRYRVVP